MLQKFGEKFIQVGGGIRDIKTVERLINIGATYVVVGTTVKSWFLERVCSEFSNKSSWLVPEKVKLPRMAGVRRLN